jgi:hypothetical protein
MENNIEIISASWDGTDLTFSSKILSRKTRDEQKVSKNKNAEVIHGSSTEFELMMRFHQETNIIIASNIARRALEKSASSLNEEQRLAYDQANLHLSGQAQSPLLMVITGDGGSGKSYLTKTICKSAFLMYGRQLHDRFPSLALDCKCKDSALRMLTNQTISVDQIGDLKHRLSTCVLFILKNVQFLSLEELYQISNRMGLLNGKPHLAFGGTNTILEGNLYQRHHYVNGTHLIGENILETNLRAKAGHSILEQLNYFVNLGVPMTDLKKKMKFNSDSCHEAPYHTNNSSGLVELLLKQKHNENQNEDNK